jgi:hypothetical protein
LTVWPGIIFFDANGGGVQRIRQRCFCDHYVSLALNCDALVTQGPNPRHVLGVADKLILGVTPIRSVALPWNSAGLSCRGWNVRESLTDRSRLSIGHPIFPD